MRQLAQASRVSQQNNEAQRRGSGGGGGGGGGGGVIKGKLTLVGLQEAVLAARGSQVFTPMGDGPSIVPGKPGSPNLTTAAVSPVAEA
jgi:hypothetical protein